ncbi:MAG: S1-like domain-containing RNA-binding protein [Spongiibacteraceae bacterium]
MATIGLFNQLSVVRNSEFGVYLDGEQLGDILLPNRSVPEGCKIGDELNVFIYLDSEDRLVATLDKPLVMVGEFAWLTVLSVTNVGAFLDWGLPKDLLLPFAEQKYPPEVGRRVMVRVYLDNSNRLAASTRIDDFLEEESDDFVAGQEVDLLITDSTDLGYKAIVDNSHWGVLYSNELFQNISKGQRIRGYIKRIREDRKIDLTLDKPGFERIPGVAEQILATLKEHDGFMLLTDKSSPETIRSLFKVSKKVYKKAIGTLYKQRLIDIEEKGIRLIKK